MTQQVRDDRLARHYGRRDLLAVLDDALRAAGKAEGTLRPDDLAPVDQFHTCGIIATRELAQRAAVTAETRVLDLGGGIGGVARLLAAIFGCYVEVPDRTEVYCAAGRMLTERCGLAERVQFRYGDATAPPYADAQFDLVWAQHSTMNIADIAALYRGATRVLRSGGRLALHEIVARPADGLHLLVPWAGDAGLSYLRPPDVLRAQIRTAGFVELAWHDETATALQWFEQRVAAMDAGSTPPLLGLHLLLGPETATLFRNLLRNLQQERIVVAQGVFERPYRLERRYGFRKPETAQASRPPDVPTHENAR